MKIRMKNQMTFLLFLALTGGVIGGIIWAFLKIMGVGIEVVWEVIPENLDFKGYTIVVCLLGGAILGLYQKRYGAYPQELNEVMRITKEKGTYPYDHIFMLCIAALLPLIFGGSIGPEAGMTGVIVGLCCWAGDNFKYAGKHVKELTEIGMEATLTAIFHAPLFGVITPIESETNSDEEVVLPKSSKMVTYILAALCSLGTVALLTHLFGGGLGMPSLPEGVITSKERIWAVPVILIGFVAAAVYFLTHVWSEKIFSKIQGKNLIVVSTMLGGLILGIVGTLFPITMFSGEEQMAILSESYTTYFPWILILIGFLKLVVTNICIQSGWRGGHFFPVIFAGVAIGYGVAGVTGLDPVFTIALLTSVILGGIIKKPLAVVLLLMLCFPARYIVWMMVGACLGAYVFGFFSKKRNMKE